MENKEDMGKLLVSEVSCVYLCLYILCSALVEGKQSATTILIYI